jgi:hypothetical protein
MTTQTPISDMSSTQNSPPTSTSIARATDNAGYMAIGSGGIADQQCRRCPSQVT